MRSIRTFIAVELSGTVIGRAQEAIKLLKTSGAEVGWVDRAQMHLTLKFLGNVPEVEAPDVCRVVAEAAAEGEPFEIVVSYHARAALKDVAISIDIDLPDGTRLATLHSDFHGERFQMAAGSGAFSCAIAGLPLRPDTYVLNIALGGPHALYDFVERAMSFEMAPADVYGTGRLPQRNQGPLLADYRWRLTEPATILS